MLEYVNIEASPILSPKYVQTKSCHYMTSKYIKDNPSIYKVVLLGKPLKNRTYIYHSYTVNLSSKKSYDCQPDYTVKLKKDKDTIIDEFIIDNRQ